MNLKRLSPAGEVELLPALPEAWNTGYIHGVMARGGFEVDIDWENGKLKQARVLSKLGNPLKLSCQGKETELKRTDKGKSYTFNESLSFVPGE